jgi:hypothetical protein
VNGTYAITAKTTFASTGTTTINNGSFLRLDGGTLADPNTIAGAIITGVGTLHADGAHALVGYGTISTAAIDFRNGSELRAKGGTLTVNGNGIQEMGAIGTADSTGTLNFSSSYNIFSTHKLDLKGGYVTGAAIANQGLIIGHGTITTEQLANSNTISAAGGELVLNPNGTLDLDGVLGGVPIVNAAGGDINVAKSISDSFDGIANVGGGRTMRFANGWSIGSGGTVNLSGTLVQPATIASDSAQILLGRVNVSFGGVFNAPTGFFGGSSVSLPSASDQLSLLKGATVNTNSTFTGNGSLRNAPASELLVSPGATIGVHLQNEGSLRVSGDNQVGTIFLKSMSETATATTKLEIGGPFAGAQFDRIELSAGATVDGTLALATLNGYMPANLIPHEILHATGGVSGTFDTITGVQITPTKYWAVTYDADSVFATAARPGDANLDGTVNLADFNILASHFGTGGSTWQSADFSGDGLVNLADFNLLAGNFGLAASGAQPSQEDWSALASQVPEPGSLSLLMTGAAMLMRRRRNRR